MAVASGVPAELGLIAGVLPGGGLRVSGPAGGLTVVVYEAARAYGLDVLGVLVCAAGVVQLGVFRLGRWFRAVSVAVVQGMLAGQVYAMGDVSAPASALGKVSGLVSLPGDADPVALAVGGATVAVLLLWRRWGQGRGARLGRSWLFEGVVVGLVLAVGKVAWDISHVHREIDEPVDGPADGVVVVRVVGRATFLRCPSCLTLWRRCLGSAGFGWSWAGFGIWTMPARRPWRGGPPRGVTERLRLSPPASPRRRSPPAFRPGRA